MRRNPTVFLGLLFAALALSLFLASINFTVVTYRFFDQWAIVCSAQNAINMRWQFNSPDWIDQIPDGDMPLGDLPVGVKDELGLPQLERSAWLDDWGNPYRVVKQTSEGTTTVGVYSTGIDGVSSTGGNDPDDLNGWDRATTDYYSRKIRIENIWDTLGTTILIFVFLGPGFVLMYKGSGRKRRHKSGLCSQCGYDLRGSDSCVCSECGHLNSLPPA